MTLLIYINGQSQAPLVNKDGTPVDVPPFQSTFVYPAVSGGIGTLEYNDLYSSLGDKSGWSWFAKTLFALRGEEMIFVPVSVGSSSMLQASSYGNGSGFHDPRVSGPDSLYPTARDTMLLAKEMVALSPRFQNLREFYMFNQGGHDALSINGTTVTGTLYQAAMEAHFAQVNADISPESIHVFQTGTYKTDPANAGYADIRAAQTAAVNNTANASMMWDKSGTSVTAVFDVNGEWVSGHEYRAADNVHYSDAMNKAIGIRTAQDFSLLL